MRKIIVILMLLLELMITGTLIYIMVKWQNVMTKEQVALDFIMSVLGIAVSAWLGLNIYNLLEKAELDNIQRNMNREREAYDKSINLFQKKITKTSDKIKELTENIKHIDNMQDDIYMNLLEERVGLFESTLNIHNTWYNVFKNAIHREEEKTTFEIYGMLTQIEKMYYEAYCADQADFNQDALIYCQEGLRILQQCRLMFRDQSYMDSKRNFWYVIYLLIRESDFYYFMGNYHRNNKDFEAKLYKDEYTREIDILVHIDQTIKCGELTINDPSALAKHYNTIAVSYIFLMDLHDEDYEEYRFEAMKYSCKCIATGHANARAYRNHGVILERTGKLTEAKKNYKYSIQLDNREYKSYLCLASLELKKNTKLLFCVIDGKEEINIQYIHSEEFKKLAMDLLSTLTYIKCGINYAYDSADFHNKLGLCYSYQCLVESNTYFVFHLIEESEREFSIAEQLHPGISSVNKQRLQTIKQYIHNHLENDHSVNS